MESTTAADRLKEEAFKKAHEQQARSQQQSQGFTNNSAEENQSNLVDNIGQLFANSLTKPVMDSFFKHLGLNLKAEVNRMATSQPDSKTEAANPSSFDVFVSSEVQSYGASRVISSTVVSASLPSSATISNGKSTNGNSSNGNGFTPKN